MRIKHVGGVFLVAACTVLLSGCLASALVGGAITHEMVGPPGVGSYTTNADTSTVFQDVQSELLKIGTIKSANRQTGEIIGFDALKHYAYVAKVHAAAQGTGSVLDLRVDLAVGALSVGHVKTGDVMNAFVDHLNDDLAGAPLIPVVKQG